MPSASRVMVYLAVFAIGFVAVSLLSFGLVVRPRRIAILLTPQHYHLPAEDVVIRSADGLKLAGWFIPAEGGRPNAPVVVLLHGYPAEKADMLDLALAFHPDFATLLLDMRYFGKSQGRFTTLGLRERQDLKDAVSFLTARGFTRIGVLGFSLGGAVGIMTAAEDERIKAVASYASFADLITLGSDAYARLGVLKYPLLELMVLWAKIFLGGDVTTLSPAAQARSLSQPLLLIHSREDEEIPFHHAELIAAELSENPQASFYFLERGRHGELPPDFDERVRAFFLRHLGGG